jgi:hypothetical protein
MAGARLVQVARERVQRQEEHRTGGVVLVRPRIWDRGLDRDGDDGRDRSDVIGVVVLSEEAAEAVLLDIPRF